MAERRLAAVDLGAESGRVIVGSLDGRRISLQDAHRFANRPLWLPDGLHWNLPELLRETLSGLAAAADGGRLDGIGIDAWGCDYALLDGADRLLGMPYHYRDERTTPELIAAVQDRLGADRLYRATGIQTMAINTIFQLAADAATGSPALAAARRIALVPDLLGLWLSGTLVNELTAASTTGLLAARGHGWATDIVAALGLPTAPFQGTVAPPGVDLGPVLAHHRDVAGDAAGAIVRTVAGHDTASAFVAAPLRDERAAVLSSGTWSLLGLELSEPELGPEAQACNLTNERGIDGTTRLLRNVMGLWLVQRCRRSFAVEGGYEQLIALAAQARPDVPLLDPDDDTLLRGEDVPGAVARLCVRSGQPAPEGPGETVRSILTSLACKYRLVLGQLQRVSGRRVDVIHVVGGGARNALLCQLTADVVGLPVLAGPVEATALGNLLVQAQALGELSGRAQLRELSRASTSLTRYEPTADGRGDETYGRFLTVTGLAAPDGMAMSKQGEP